MPDFLENRDEWFSYWDQLEHGGNESGTLTQKQVVRALSKTFRHLEKAFVESVVSDLWPEFDTSNAGLLGTKDLMKPQMGLIDVAHMQILWCR